MADTPGSSRGANHDSSFGFCVHKKLLFALLRCSERGLHVFKYTQGNGISCSSLYRRNVHQPHCYIAITQIVWAVPCLLCPTFAWVSIGVVSRIGSLPTDGKFFQNLKIARRTPWDTCDNLTGSKASCFVLPWCGCSVPQWKSKTKYCTLSIVNNKWFIK